MIKIQPIRFIKNTCNLFIQFIQFILLSTGYIGPTAEGHLVTTYRRIEDDISATLHDDCKMGFVSLKYKTWVVDQRQVKPGSLRLFSRFGTDDIEEENKINTINKIKQKNSRILINNTLMDYPTQVDRQT